MKPSAAAMGVALLLPAAAVAQRSSSSPPPALAFERAIEVGAAGRTAVRLDGRLYESARGDLGDVRVLDEDGGLVPFVIDRGQAAGRPADVAPEIRNRGWLADRSASAVLDFGGRVAKDRLRLDLSGDNFRRRVAVEGSDDGERWASVVDEAWVFAVPGDEPARYEVLELPANDFRYLRVAVHPGPDERERVRIVGARLPAGEGRSLRDEVLEPRWSRAEDARSHETWLMIDLAAGQQPFLSLSVDVADERFFRETIVEARRDVPLAGAAASGVRWIEIGRGILHRLEHGGVHRESLKLDVSGRERWLRLRVKNADDRPLAIRGVSVRLPLERLLFEAVPGRSYRLAYGSPTAAAPRFDLARTAADAEEWGRSALPAGLGVPRRQAPAAGAPRPWTERHPALLWGGLVAVVTALGALTWRALRAA